MCIDGSRPDCAEDEDDHPHSTGDHHGGLGGDAPEDIEVHRWLPGCTLRWKSRLSITFLISQKKGVLMNPDTSVEIYFPKAPKGKESNWIQTVPGKGWSVVLRLYGPLQPWFDKTWRPGEIELLK